MPELFLKYLKTDLRRAFLSRQFLLSSMGIFCVYLFAGMETKQWHMSVIYTMRLVYISMPAQMTYPVAATVFATSIVRDLEHNYYSQQIFRGGITEYVSARVTAVFISTVCAVTAGSFLYLMVLRGSMPWNNPIDGMAELYQESGPYHSVIRAGAWPIYFLLCSLRTGVMEAMYILPALACTFLYTDSLFLVSLPMLFWYLVNIITENIPAFAYINFYWILHLEGSPIHNEWLLFLLVIVEAVFLQVLVIMILQRGFWKKLAGR